MRDWGVTVPQLLCLRTVAEQGPMTTGNLVRQVNLNGSRVSRIADHLVKGGLLNWEPGTEILRVAHLSARTIGNYRDRIKENPHLKTAAELTVHAVRWNAVDDRG